MLSLILTGSPNPMKRSGYSSKRSGPSLPIKVNHTTSSDGKAGDVFRDDFDDRRLFVRLNEDPENNRVKSQDSHTTIVNPAIHKDTQKQPKRTSPTHHSYSRWLGVKWAKDRTGSVPSNDYEMSNVQGRSINVQSDVEVHWAANQRD